jgi:hypothetical protein
MKPSFMRESPALAVSLTLILTLCACKTNLVVLTPQPTNATAQVNGFTMDNQGHYVIDVKFNERVDQSTVMVGKTLLLKFSKDANADATLSWSPDGLELKITTTKTRPDLNTFNPDDSFSLTLIGTDAGNGVVKSAAGKVLDGDYQDGAGGDYRMGFTLIG